MIPLGEAIAKLEKLRIDDLISVQKHHMQMEGRLAEKMAKKAAAA